MKDGCIVERGARKEQGKIHCRPLVYVRANDVIIVVVVLCRYRRKFAKKKHQNKRNATILCAYKWSKWVPYAKKPPTRFQRRITYACGALEREEVFCSLAPLHCLTYIGDVYFLVANFQGKTMSNYVF